MEGDALTAPGKPTLYRTGDPVKKSGGDYQFSGNIVTSFLKRNGALRYVVEDSRGLLFIFNHNQLEPWDQDAR